MRALFHTVAVCCIGVLAVAGEFACAAPENMLGEYGIRRWRGEDGLGEDIVNGVEQGRNGYIWCVTPNQILRFDGQRFSRIGQSGWRGVAGDHRGGLWFYGDGGVVRFEGSSRNAPPKPETRQPIYAMEEDAKGVMWGAGERGLYRFDGPKPVFYPCLVDGSPAAVVEMDMAPDGQILAIGRTEQGARLLRFQKGTFSPEPLPAASRDEDALKVHVGPAGTVWIATTRHLLSRSAGVWRAIPFPEGQSDWYGIRTMLERQDGELWVGTLRGLFRWRGETWSELTTRDGFFPFAVRSLKEDREGALWVAGTGGLMRLTPNALQVFPTGLALEKEPFISLLHSGSQWWAGIAGVKPLVGVPGRFEPAGIAGFPENTTPSAMLRARDGALWIGTHSNNLWRWKDGKSEVILPQRGADIPLTAITTLHQDRSGKIWAGTLGGLAVVTPSGLAPAEVGNAHPGDTVNVITEDEDGTLWVGYQTLGLLRLLRDGSAVWFRRGEELPDNSVRAIFRDKAGTLWIGTSAGLARWAKNRKSVFTAAQGLADDAIRQIIEDDFGCLWLGSRSGVMRVNLSDFPEVESGAKEALAVRYFRRGDGMKSEECTGAAPVKTADGKLWFPTADGLVMADPKSLPKTMELPVVSIEEMQAGGQTVWGENLGETGKGMVAPVRVPAPARDVEFRFSSTDYFAPERLRFKYRLEGLDAEWSAPTAARTAFYREIPPGRYRFRVEACSRDGVWSATDSSLAFEVPPLFWQTLGFRAAATALGFAGVVALVVRREREKSRRKLLKLEHEQALERERARIARDIHDEVGAGLTEVALLSELAQSGTPGPEKKYLDDIFKTARDLTRSLDEIVWSINPANDTLEKLISYLVEFARDFLGTASLPCRLDVPTVLPEVTVAATVRHQVCLAVKETLNNIVKHAQASEVHMEVRWEEERLSIVVRDNGRGFARDTLEDPAATRDGLDNIAARMREIGGRCEQQSGIGKGTCTVLSVKIPIAADPAPER